MPYAISAGDVRDAARRIAGQAHRTPVMTCGALDQMGGCRLFFKCDQFQKVGAFKFRGAYHAVSRLSDEEAERGVVTHSSGNHAQAVALAARMRGIPARIVMPSSAPPVKKRAVEGYGAAMIECEPTLAAREATASAVIDETGATFIHPYDNAHVMAGQGTAALELLQDVPDLDALLVPVGGGGLLGGCTIIARDLRPGIRVFAAEPSGADDAARSKRAGRRILQTAPDTVADGLRSSVGERNWPILRDLVDDVLTVNDDAIIRAMRLLFERAKLLVEASAAVPLAAALSSAHRSRFEGPGRLRVGIVLSGGNQDLDKLPWLT